MDAVKEEYRYDNGSYEAVAHGRPVAYGTTAPVETARRGVDYHDVDVFGHEENHQVSGFFLIMF